MNLRFSLVPVPSDDKKHRAMVQPGSGATYEQFLKHVQKQTSLTQTDVDYVIDAIADWIVTCALDGRECDIGKLGRSRLGVRGTFDTPTPDRISHDDVEVTLATMLSPQVRKIFRSRIHELKLEQVQPKDLRPVVKWVTVPLAHGQHENNAWKAGNILHIKGDNLSFDKRRKDEGVFLTNPSTRETIRASVYERGAIKNIVCLVPPQLAGAGALHLEIRRRPRANLPEPLVGEFGQDIEELE